MNDKDDDLIKTWMNEAGWAQPSPKLKHQILKKIESHPIDYRPVIAPIFWKMMGLGLSGILLYALFFPAQEGSTSSWWQTYYPLHGVAIDINFDFFANTSPQLAYALLIFCCYIYLFPVLMRWWNNRLVS